MNITGKKYIFLKSTKLQTNINYEYLDQKFEFIDRTRNLEFQRNWNISDSLFNSSNSIN